MAGMPDPTDMLGGLNIHLGGMVGTAKVRVSPDPQPLTLSLALALALALSLTPTKGALGNASGLADGLLAGMDDLAGCAAGMPGLGGLGGAVGGALGGVRDGAAQGFGLVSRLLHDPAGATIPSPLALALAPNS